MWNLVRAEIVQLWRHRIVALSAVAAPLIFAGVLLATRDQYDSAGSVAAMQVAVMASLGVYVTATTALAARRQHLFLKRLRTTPLSPSAIVAGMVLPSVLLSLIQTGIVLAVLAAVGSAPGNLGVVVAGVVALNLILGLLAVATSGVTSSPDHAQVTTLPIFLLVVGGAIWVAITGTTDQAGLKRLTPGGSISELVMQGWAGAPVGDVAPLVGPIVAWVVVGAVLARSTFRWEPRS